MSQELKIMKSMNVNTTVLYQQFDSWLQKQCYHPKVAEFMWCHHCSIDYQQNIFKATMRYTVDTRLFYITSIHKHLWNGVTLREQDLSLNSCQSYQSKVCFLWGIDLYKKALHCGSLWVKGLQSCGLSNFNIIPSLRTWSRAARGWCTVGWAAEFFSNLQFW